MGSFPERSRVRVKADYAPGLSRLPERLTSEQAAGEDGVILITSLGSDGQHKVSLRNGLRGDFYSWELEAR